MISRLSTVGRGNAVFCFVFIPCVLLGTLYYNRLSDDARAKIETRYELESETRHARLVGAMTTRRQLLGATVAFLERSSRVDSSSFRKFVARATESQPPIVALCWAPNHGPAMFAGSKASDERLCQGLDFLEPSRVVLQPAPMLMLSRYVSRGGTASDGFSSIIFEFKSLLLEAPMVAMDEYLIVQDTIKNTLESYSFNGAELSYVGELSLSESDSYQHYPLASVGTVNFLYLTRNASAAVDLSAYLVLLLVLWSLSLVLALYVRRLAIQRDLVAHEVDVRTAELSQFAYRTSHDLRAPLVTVGGLCQAASEDLAAGDVEEVRDNLQRIETHVTRLDDLVGDILSLTRADLQQEEEGPVEFEGLVKEVVRDVTNTLESTGVAIDILVDVPTPYIGSRVRLAQTLNNLISNAIKYADTSKIDAFVRVEVRQTELLLISVADNGLGMSADQLSRVFDSFSRFHPEASKIGSGLGMAIVKKHVERMQGQISGESGPDGTVFSIQLPLSGRRSRTV